VLHTLPGTEIVDKTLHKVVAMAMDKELVRGLLAVAIGSGSGSDVRGRGPNRWETLEEQGTDVECYGSQ